ncbi:MAG: isoleucine--tRNA ligase [Candidatus Symbiodolus clandestinus]
MNDYKATLNLPTTDFPMRAALSQREPQTLQRWNQQDLYKAIRQAKQGCPRFILHDGPPYANGDIHVGHALNKILKDIIIKAKGLSNFDAPYIPGWDCHGLPIELKVEQQLIKEKQAITHVANFQQACRRYAFEQIEQQRQAFIRLGVLGDWQNPYLTMDFATEAATLRLLAALIEKGYLARGTKPVHWCTACRSALAEAELEYQDKTSLSLEVRFFADDAKAIAQCFTDSVPVPGQISAIIWTTTPWTLPANRALAVNADAGYQLIQVTGETGSEYLILAADRVAEWLSQGTISHWQLLGSALGADLVGLRFHHPFYAFTVPVIVGEHVTTDSGTGIVHTAPGHGPEDFIVGQREGLEIANPVGDDGCYLPETEKLAGCSIFTVDQSIIALLQQQGTLLRHAKIQHSYPHCWRHRTPVIFRTVPQWFISMNPHSLREQALQQITQVNWLPEWGEARIRAMVASRPDWCISRQRAWGTPLALFIHKESGQWHPRTTELLQQIAQRVAQQGIGIWWDLDPKDLLGDEAVNYDKCLDILDVWFDSGATYATVVAERPEYAGANADLYLEGSDQHRGWFMSSLMLSTAIKGTAPYRQVLTHGFTVDSQGRKMSKSLGNVISAQEIIDNFGADILRLWVAATDYRAEITLSADILQGTTDLYRRIRNTARFLLANLNGFDPQQHLVAHEQLITIDQWAIARAQQLQQQLITAYEQYEFHRVVQLVMHFCSIEMGSFYLDIIKDRQYTTKTNSLARRSCQTALYHIAEALVRWIAPILSFTADEMWQHLPGQRSISVFTEIWYQPLAMMAHHALLNEKGWEQLMNIRNAVNGALEQARTQKIIGSPLAAAVTLYAQPTWTQLLLALSEELRFLLLVSQANVVPVTEPPINTDSSCQPCALPGLWISVTPACGSKCPRCWHYHDSNEKNSQPLSEAQPELCQRCHSNVWGTGEIRRFV